MGASAVAPTVDPQAQFKPVDQAVGHPQLEALRSHLLKAAITRDIGTIEKLSAPSVRGCGWSGFAGLRSFFAAKGPEYDPWEHFRRSLSLGGVLQSPDEFNSNYLASTFPRRNLEHEFYSVIV